MGISDEAMKPISAPKDVMAEAVAKIQPDVQKITEQMISDMKKRLKMYENAPNYESVREYAKKTILDYLMSLHERRFLLVEPPFTVTMEGKGATVEFKIDPYPFLTPVEPSR